MTGRPASVAFTLTVVMESDWHVGTGGGRHGAIDRLIERDVDDLPFLPATTVRGIWRDAAERLALGLDDGDPAGGWAAIVEALFGDQPALGGRDRSGDPLSADDSEPERLARRAGAPSGARPRPGALSLGSARLPKALRDALGGRADAGRTRLRQALTFVKPGVAIDPASGRARQDHLRFEEVARQGAVLVAQGRVALPPDDRAAAAMLAVLAAATGLVERLGGKRRRGTGRCAWTIAVDDPAPVRTFEDAVRVLSGSETAPRCPLPAADDAAPLVAAHAEPAEGEAWVTVPLELRLRSPLVIADAVQGNVVTSLDFIPGTCLLPHVSATLRGLGGGAIAAAIAVGDIRVSAALPVVGGHRGLPVPFAWARVKDDRQGPDGKGQIVNRAVEDDDRQLKPVRAGYVDAAPALLDGRPPALLTGVRKLVRTHNTVEDAVQRPTEAVGGVYSYEALEPGLRLRAIVRVRQALADRLPDGWSERFATQTLRLGRAAKAGYGEAEVTLCDEPPPPEPRPLAPAGRMTVFFAADALLRPPLLGAGTTREAVVDAVRAATGLTGLTAVAAPPPSDQGRSGGPAAVAEDGRLWPTDLRVRRIESWAAAWHLPRPSLIAIQAGSYVTLETADGSAIPPEALKRLQDEGLGERRAEGYGEVLVNSWLLSKETSAWQRRADGQDTAADPPLPSIDEAALRSDEMLFRFAQQIEDAAWRKAFADAAFIFAADPGLRQRHLGWTATGDQGRPPMSQLGALRSMIAALDDDTQVEQALAWVASVEKTANRRDKWGDGLAHLRRLIDGKTDVWALLLGAEGTGLPATLVRTPDALKDLFRHEAVRAQLLASILAHKRDLEAGRSGEGARPRPDVEAA